MNIADLKHIFNPQIKEDTTELYFSVTEDDRIMVGRWPVTDLTDLLLTLDNYVFDGHGPGNIARFISIDPVNEPPNVEVPSMLVERARMCAITAHTASEQYRKFTNEPYWHHPAEVAKLVSTVPHTDEMIAAAWLHDVVEDTVITDEFISSEFGETVATYVEWLTDLTSPEFGSRAFRKAHVQELLASAPAEVQTIKVCDIISNTKNKEVYDEKFAQVYLAEKRDLLAVLTRADPTLIAIARQQLAIQQSLF